MKKWIVATFEIEADSKQDAERLFYKVENSKKAEIMCESFDDSAEELKARIGYNKKEDAYELLISTDGGDTWGMSVSSKCRRCEGQSEEEEPMFVSIGLLEELKRAVALGYRIVY